MLTVELFGDLTSSKVSFHFDHWWAFLFHYLMGELSIITTLDFELSVDGIHIRQLVDATMGFQAIEKGLKNAEAHFAKSVGCLIAVYSSI
jgi:hypothetical protein